MRMQEVTEWGCEYSADGRRMEGGGAVNLFMCDRGGTLYSDHATVSTETSHILKREAQIRRNLYFFLKFPGFYRLSPQTTFVRSSSYIRIRAVDVFYYSTITYFPANY
jgi:hypothetical protein